MSNIFNFIFFIIIIAMFSCSSDEVPTCNDGIQNNNETGVDCGGNCVACDLPLEAVYKGNLKGFDTYNNDELKFELNNVQVTIEGCSSDCIEVTFITQGGTAKTEGIFNKGNSFYSLDLDPVYEDPNNIMPWEEDWPRGTGTFDWSNNEMVIFLQVDDEHANGSTDVVYFYEGEQQ